MSKTLRSRIIGAVEEDVLNKTFVGEGDEAMSASFVSVEESIIPETQFQEGRRSISHGDLRGYVDLIEENRTLRETVERLKEEHIQMEGAVVKKDELLVKREDEISQLRLLVSSMAVEMESLKREESNLMRTVGVLSDDLHSSKGQVSAKPTTPSSGDMERRVRLLESLVQELFENRAGEAKDKAQIDPSNVPELVKEVTSPAKLRLIGDSILKPINVKLANGGKVSKSAIGGATIRRVEQEVQKDLKCVPESVVIHCGTNDIVADRGRIKNLSFMKKQLKGLMKTAGNVYKDKEVIVSGLLFRGRVNHKEICHLNDFIAEQCNERKFTFVDANCWVGFDGMARDGLHLNGKGAREMTNLFERIVNKNKKNL